jgi:2-polyprenyl-6-methoxyphenol hydroxylase-like FAD-dependent oxidoreductase
MPRVIIAGGGIGGMATALSLHAVGITDVHIYESAAAIRELGVGLTLQPHSVRELAELGLLDELSGTGMELTELAYFTKRGQRIWTEPRGLAAGHRWPQLAIHRGALLMILYRAVQARLGTRAVHPGHHLARFGEHRDGTVWAQFTDRRTGTPMPLVRGDVLVGADGVHSVVRRILHPHEGPPPWTGITVWRGTTEAAPFLGGHAMAQAGYHGRQVVVYPISQRYADRGRALVNWVALYRIGQGHSMGHQDWDHQARRDDVLKPFGDYTFDWLDVPDLVRRAPVIYQYPLVDRDPLPWWGTGPVTLLGDAAHPMYPYGGNGAAQAILDARALARALSGSATVAGGLAEYEAQRRPATTEVVLANRRGGPEACLDLVEQRAPNGFERIEDVISTAELAEITSRYQQIADHTTGSRNGCH